MQAMARALSKPGNWSCSWANSSNSSGGTMSGRVERAWPALMKAGPRSTSRLAASRARARARSLLLSRPNSQSLPTPSKYNPIGTSVCQRRLSSRWGWPA